MLDQEEDNFQRVSLAPVHSIVIDDIHTTDGGVDLEAAPEASASMAARASLVSLTGLLEDWQQEDFQRVSLCAVDSDFYEVRQAAAAERDSLVSLTDMLMLDQDQESFQRLSLGPVDLPNSALAVDDLDQAVIQELSTTASFSRFEQSQTTSQDRVPLALGELAAIEEEDSKDEVAAVQRDSLVSLSDMLMLDQDQESFQRVSLGPVIPTHSTSNVEDLEQAMFHMLSMTVFEFTLQVCVNNLAHLALGNLVTLQDADSESKRV
jgi:hypothetical protein